MSPLSPKAGRLLRAGLLCAATTALALVAAELVLHRLQPPPGAWVWPPGMRQTMRPRSEFLRGVSGQARFVVNSQGVRGDELPPPPRYAILALGGSTTECLYLDQEETWPALVQRHLSRAAATALWVGNAGKAGLSSRHNRVQLEHFLAHHPDIDGYLVLVGGNDLLRRLEKDSGYRPDYLTDPVLSSRIRRQSFTVVDGGDRGWLGRSQIWTRLRQLNRLRKAVPHVQDPEGRSYEVWRARRRNAGGLRDRLPDLAPALAEYRANLRAMIELARRRSARLVLLTQPAMWWPGLGAGDRDQLWLGGVGGFRRHDGADYYTVEALADGMARYNQALLELCAAEMAECIDLAGLLPRQPELYYDDLHFTERGAATVARAIADHFLRRPPFAARP